MNSTSPMNLYRTSGGFLLVIPVSQKMYWIYNTHVSVEVLNEVAYEGLEEADFDVEVISMVENAKAGSEKLMIGGGYDLLMGIIQEKAG